MWGRKTHIRARGLAWNKRESGRGQSVRHIFFPFYTMGHTPLLASASASFENKIPDSGTYPARCIQVIDLWTQTIEWQWQTKEQRKIRLTFELPTELETFNPEKGEQPFVVSKNYTLSLSDKSKLREHLESWRGQEFTQQELDWFDIYNILGKECTISVVHEKSVDGTKTYANLSTVSKAMKGMNIPEAINPLVYFTIEDFDQTTYDSLPEFLRNKIAESKEYKALQSVDKAFVEDIYN